MKAAAFMEVHTSPRFLFPHFTVCFKLATCTGFKIEMVEKGSIRKQNEEKTNLNGIKIWTGNTDITVGRQKVRPVTCN